MKWPTIDQMSAMAPLPDGYRYERLKRCGIGGAGATGSPRTVK